MAKAKSKTISAVVDVREGHVFWTFKNKPDVEIITQNPMLIVSAKIKFDPKTEIYWLERPTTKPDMDKLNTAFQEAKILVDIADPELDDNILKTDNLVLQEGRVLVKAYKDAGVVMDKAEKDLEVAKTNLRGFVVEKGAKTKPGTDDSILIIDDLKFQHQYTTGRANKNEALILAYMKKEQPLKVKTVEVVDWDNISEAEYEAIPLEVRQAYENRGEATYRFMEYDLAKFKCTSCGHHIGKSAKFCPECGTPVAKK